MFHLPDQPTLAITGTILGILCAHADPVQAANFGLPQNFFSPEEKISVSFLEEFNSGATLMGEFSGEDVNQDGTLTFNEFVSFTAIILGGKSGFENVTWNLNNLSPTSTFIDSWNYKFEVSDPVTRKGWQTQRIGGDVGGGVYFGYFLEPGSSKTQLVDTSKLIQFTRIEPSNIEAVPEPATIAGLALASIGFATLKRQQKGGKSA